MDWTFWVGAVVIVVLLIATQVFLHESRWSRRPRPEEPEAPGKRAELDGPDSTAENDPPNDRP